MSLCLAFELIGNEIVHSFCSARQFDAAELRCNSSTLSISYQTEVLLKPKVAPLAYREQLCLLHIETQRHFDVPKPYLYTALYECSKGGQEHPY